MTQTGAEYDHNAEITALLHRHNLETAYGHNLVGNNYGLYKAPTTAGWTAQAHAL